MQYPGSCHNHTHFSNLRLRDCIVKEQDLIDYAIELGHSVIAITDHESIASAVRIEKIKQKGLPIKIIMGNEIYLCRNGLNEENFIPNEDKYYHFILLAKDLIGYKQICELSTRAWLRSYMGRGLRRVPTYYQDIIDVIGKNPGHVIGSTACLGSMIGVQLLKYRDTEEPQLLWDKILKWCVQMQSIFGKDYFYLELQPSATHEQTYVNRQLITISQILDIPYIITCDTHYLKKEDREIHKAFLNAQNGEREVDSFYATTYLMSTEDLESHLDLTREEIYKGYKNIEYIKNLCEDYSILKPLKIPSLKNREYDINIVSQEWIDKIPALDKFVNSNNIDDNKIAAAVVCGIKDHDDLQNAAAYKELNDNLEMTWESSKVNNVCWSSYFLNLQKVIELCWDAGSLVGAGRGSGVGFLLLYALDIIQINCLRETTKTFSWRFLNPKRVSVLDVDVDIEGSKRTQVLDNLRNYYGAEKVSNVTTFRTEKSKSAILTAARGLGIDNNEAQYLASLIPEDRGQLRSLSEVFYGSAEKDFKPIPAFVKAMETDYKQLWNVAQKIENLICGSGIHAGGVILVDEPFTEVTGLMRAPDGTVCTQFDLHDAEDVSLIKLDLLSIEALDKIHICLDLLLRYGYIKQDSDETLRQIYERTIGIYQLDRDSEDMWQMVWNHKILSLFQMEKQSGIQGIRLIHPKNVNDLSVLNSVIRLMAPDKDSETPLNTWAKYRKNINLWIEEMKNFGLSNKEIDWLSHHSAITDGICESQEGLMSLVQEKELGGNTLEFADKCRKGIAKKQGKLFEECEQQFFKSIEEKQCSQKLADYVWNHLLRVQRGYSFNRSHCLAYSLIGLQEMNLAYKFPLIFWNCAVLISDSRCAELDGTTDYAKIAKAIGKISSAGVHIVSPDINTSEEIFVPDVKNNEITYGLQAIQGINSETIKLIKQNRPYNGIKDFITKNKFNKTIIINLIKAGAFDRVDKYLHYNRYEIMIYYLLSVSNLKTTLNLRNLNGLIQKNLIPKELELQKKIFNFNKYLKNYCKVGQYYKFDNICDSFYNKYFDTDLLEIVQGCSCILQKTWDKMYQIEMDTFREWLKENQKDILQKFNYSLFKDQWDKYAKGNLSHWEMEATCFYYHEHELSQIDYNYYGLSNFFNLPINKIERYWKQFPIYNLYKIIGTVLARDDKHSTITLLTREGVIDVKLNKDQYNVFKKTISEIREDGTKKQIEESWFGRGNMLLFTGYRKTENEFIVKTYSRTLSHSIYHIDNIINNKLILRHERIQVA